MSPRNQRRQDLMDVFELGGVAAAVVAAYQSHLLQALLNGSATPAMYAEELGLDSAATERVLAVLAAVGIADCEQGRYAASADLQHVDAWHLGGIDALGALWSQVPAFLLHGERLAHMDGPPAQREAAYSPVVSRLAEVFAEAARHLAAELPGNPTQILDVGAGSGIWSLTIAERHPQARAIYGLHLALRTRQGKAHILSDLRAWVEQAGLIAGEVIALETPRGMGALVAHAPGKESPTGEG